MGRTLVAVAPALAFTTFAVLLVSACASSESSKAGARDSTAAADMASQPGETTLAGDRGPVLVELFTSQGCSSCPPADRLLSKIGDGKLGDDVIPLAYHVDYWNYIGWSDPFSKKAWTALQRRYGKTLSRGRVYTPMLVIDGAAHVVGSDAGSAEDEIDEARDRRDRVALSLTRVEQLGSELVADVTWTELEGADVYIAVTESELATAVRRGENAGRELVNDHIVRELIRVDTATAERRNQVAIPVHSSWKRDNLGLVVFARDRATLAVLGAAREQRR